MQRSVTILEGFQVGDLEQPNQGLSGNGPRRQRCPQDFGEEYRGIKRKDHVEQTQSGGKGLRESPSGAVEAAQRGFLDSRHFLYQQDLFFLTLTRKICFTAVNHLADRTVPQIFKAFKEIYQYYPHHGFRITTVHVDGEFAPLTTLIESMPGGPMVSLASSNEHVPEIEC
jgi:hypothetical protein